MSTSLAQLFEQAVDKNKDKEALVDIRLNQRWTYKEWDEEVNRLAHGLMKAGVQKGDRVSTFLFNTSEMGTALFACAKIGAVFNPINFRLKGEELAYILNDAQPKVLIFEIALSDVVDQVYNQFQNDTKFWSIDPQPPVYASNLHENIENMSNERPGLSILETDDYAIMYTSGTTGYPKGVVHRHRDMVEQSMTLITAMQFTRNDRGLVVAPMFHCAELHCAFIPRVQAGACSVILHDFRPKEVLQTLQDEKITTLFMAPTMWNMLLQEDYTSYDLHRIRNNLYGGAPMAPALVKKCKEAFNIELIQAYGMTEMGPAITLQMDDDQLRKAGSAGQTCFNHEIRIVRPNETGPSDPEDTLPLGQIGEIIVRGNSMMTNYFKRDQATQDALFKGWYHTGDLGYMDEEYFLYVADRVNDMVISGGENVYPREVEDLLFEHDGVLDVAVLGEPDEKWGEKVVAFIKKKNPELTAEELDEFCKNSSRLANYKRPRQYYFVEDLPRNASGKLQKFKLRESNQSTI